MGDYIFEGFMILIIALVIVNIKEEHQENNSIKHKKRIQMNTKEFNHDTKTSLMLLYLKEPYSYEFMVNGVSIATDILQFHKSYKTYYLLTNKGYYEVSRNKYNYSFHWSYDFTIEDKSIIRKYFGADYQSIINAIEGSTIYE